MTAKPRWQLTLGAGLLALSAAIYFVHWLIFRDAHHIWIYMVGELAFLPIEVLIVTMIIHGLLSQREKRALMAKLNMVIGAFFSEVGTTLMRQCAAVDADRSYGAALLVASDWRAGDFEAAKSAAARCGEGIAAAPEDLERLRRYLLERRGFMLRLLENPNLLEHETFTDLLWAVFHLTEELGVRGDFTASGPGDLRHLNGDLRRAYRLLVSEWIDYMRHLKEDYPYLFSLAVRTNPFDPAAAVEVP